MCENDGDQEIQRIEIVKNKILDILRNSERDARGTRRRTRQILMSELRESLNQGYNDADFRSSYSRAEQELVDRGLIERRRGPNGGIILREDKFQNCQYEQTNQAHVGAEQQPESSYYQRIINCIPEFWKSEFGAVDVVAEITASARGIRTGGTWTRPDIVVLATFDWIFSSRKEGIVTTVEIKTQQNLDITAVYEALAHRSRAHQSYLIIVSREDLENNDLFKRCLYEAERFGIGLIEVKEVEEGSDLCKNWRVHLDARQGDADPFEIHDFIMSGNIVSVESRKKFIGYLRGVPREML